MGRLFSFLFTPGLQNILKNGTSKWTHVLLEFIFEINRANREHAPIPLTPELKQMEEKGELRRGRLDLFCVFKEEINKSVSNHPLRLRTRTQNRCIWNVAETEAATIARSSVLPTPAVSQALAASPVLPLALGSSVVNTPNPRGTGGPVCTHKAVPRQSPKLDPGPPGSSISLVSTALTGNCGTALKDTLKC